MKSCLLCFALVAASTSLGAVPTEDQLAFFEKKIRPVLVEKCYDCHNGAAGKVKGGLALDTAQATRRGGDSGAAVVPGDLEHSLLVEAVRYGNADLAMPPKKAGGKLPDAVIRDFEEWIRMGAPDPRTGSAAAVEKSAKKWTDYEEAVNWWAWQLPKKQTVPQPRDGSWARGEIDRFIMSDLEEKGLRPVADADPATLVRRLYFDLIGLPPRPQEAMDFVKAWNGAGNDAEARQGLLEKVADKLLASPQFGERWGRHWLDVARYAESSGKDVNLTFPHAWRYRDYVIAAFNADKPYDEFLREQLAGDVLPATTEKEKAEHLVATGFLALGSKSLNEQNPKQFALDLVDEQIDTVSQAILATTISCARCHDHKFDPIPQREYYAMAGIFLSTETCYGTAAGVQNRHPGELIELPGNSGQPSLDKRLSPEQRKQKEEELARLKEEREELFRAAIAQRRPNGKNGQGGAPPVNNAAQGARNIFVLARTGQLEAELNSYDSEGNAKILVMGVRDQPTTRQLGSGVGDFFRRRLRERLAWPAEFSFIHDSPLFARGDVEKAGDAVPRGFVSVLSKGEVPPIPQGASGRKELAEWLVAPGNPLTARVMVNRVWSWLFGRGLVESTDNFGTTGKLPDHPELLDYLALRLREDLQWSLKKLIRDLVLTRTYQLGSSYDEKSFEADPENALCWRMSKRRLEAECIRDAILTVSSAINLQSPLGSLVGMFGDGQVGAPRLRGLGEESILNPESVHRSVYLPVCRDVLPEALGLFDFAEPSLVTGARETTNVPSQALFLMNSEFITEQSEKFADKLLSAFPSSGPNAGLGDKFKERVQWAYALCFSRWPTEAEWQAAHTYFARHPGLAEKGDGGAIKDAKALRAAWIGFCRALYASAEFRCLN